MRTCPHGLLVDPTGPFTLNQCRPCWVARPAGSFALRTHGGLGDSIAGYFAACGLASDSGREVVYRCGHPEWFVGVSHPGVTILHDGPGVDIRGDYGAELQAAADGTCQSRCQWYCNRIAGATSLRQFSPARPARVERPAAVIGTGYVLLSPFSFDRTREWPAYRWMELADQMRRDERRVVAVGASGDGERLREMFGTSNGVEFRWKQSPAWACGAVANADRVFGNDSGVAHLAGLFGVPTTAVMTHLRPSFVFDPLVYPTVTGVGADPAEWLCQGCAWREDRLRSPGCHHRCDALHGLEVRRVNLH